MLDDELQEFVRAFLGRLMENGEAGTYPLRPVPGSVPVSGPPPQQASEPADYDAGADGEKTKTGTGTVDTGWMKALRWCPRELLDLINSKACRGMSALVV